MARAQPKPAPPATLEPEIATSRKRKPSYKITDTNFVGANSNVVTKCLKQSADAAGADTARAEAVKRKKKQPSVQDVDDEDTVPLNNPPKKNMPFSKLLMEVMILRWMMTQI